MDVMAESILKRGYGEEHFGACLKKSLSRVSGHVDRVKIFNEQGTWSSNKGGTAEKR